MGGIDYISNIDEKSVGEHYDQAADVILTALSGAKTVRSKVGEAVQRLSKKKPATAPAAPGIEMVRMPADSAPSISGTRPATVLSHELSHDNVRGIGRPEPSTSGRFGLAKENTHADSTSLTKKNSAPATSVTASVKTSSVLGKEIVRVPREAEHIAERITSVRSINTRGGERITLNVYTKEGESPKTFSPGKPSIPENTGTMWVRVPNKSPPFTVTQRPNVKMFRIPAEVERLVSDKPSAKVFIREMKIEGQVEITFNAVDDGKVLGSFRYEKRRTFSNSGSASENTHTDSASLNKKNLATATVPAKAASPVETD